MCRLTYGKLMYGGALTLFAMLFSCDAVPTAYEARLADHLTATGAKMYGAYWCPHCGAQKEYFSGVADRLPYVECDAQGFGAQPELCEQMGIEVYPTWIINGEYYTGVQLPGKLAALSGFEQKVPLPSEDSADSGAYSPEESTESGAYSPAQ